MFFPSVKFKFIMDVMDWFPKQVGLERLYILEIEDKIWWCSVIEGSPILSHFEGGLGSEIWSGFFALTLKCLEMTPPPSTGRF